MKGKAFWAFFIFGAVTVLLALGGGAVALFTREGAASMAIGYLLIFMGVSLALMLGSLVWIRKREKGGSG